MIAALALLAPGIPVQGPIAPTLHVSARTGDDARGTGTPEAPFRSLTRALEQARAHGAAPLLRIDLGRYGASHGERFPLEIPAGTVLRGLTAEETVIEAGGAALALRFLPGTARTVVDSLRIEDAITAAALTGPLPLQWSNVAIERCSDGLRLEQGQLVLAGCRWRACGNGVRIGGQVALGLAIEDCWFEDNQNGLLIESGGDPSQALDLDLRAARSVFLANAVAGFHRTGAAGKTRGDAPLRLEDCLFAGNASGIHLEQPAADTPLALSRCRFLRNEYFGVQAVGGGGDEALVSPLEDCEFRWNGVGLHAVNCQVRYEVRRCLFSDQHGNAVFFANFMSEPNEGRFEDSLFVHNGAAGLFALADARSLQVVVLRCTIADNGGPGIARKDRHGGSSAFRIERCILHGNAPDLDKIQEAEVHGCLVGDGRFEGLNGNFAADPQFLDRQRRDYRSAVAGLGAPIE